VTLSEGANTITVAATDQTDRSGSDSVVVVLDTTAPTVSIVSPEAGAAVCGTIDFDAAATDASPGAGVAAVEFLVDGAPLAALAQGPFEQDLDTTAFVDGLHSLAVTATDGKGNAASAATSVVIDNTTPAVTIDQPADGAVLGGAIVFDATATDDTSLVASLSMLAAGLAPRPIDGSVAFAPAVSVGVGSSLVDTRLFADGSLVLSAEVLDAAGNAATASITVQIDNQAPDKSLITPADGAVVRGTIEITAAAQDPNLVQLELLFADNSVSSASSPLTTYFDTTSVLDGPLVITVVATDYAGNSSTCSATVTLDNIVPADDCTFTTHLNLKSKGKNDLHLKLEGANLAMLMPTEAHAWQLRIPGASPIPAAQGVAFDDDLSDDDADAVPELKVGFDRQLLINAVKASIASGAITDSVTVEVWSEGAKICEHVITKLQQ